jgi:hypothetical protein
MTKSIWYLKDAQKNSADYTLTEFRPGRFAKIVDGEIVGIATEGEVAAYLRQKHREKVDVGLIEVSLALCALLAVLFAQPWPVGFRVLSGMAFLMSFFAALNFYTSYIVQRIPLTWNQFYKSKFAGMLMAYNIRSSFWFWLFWFYPTQLIRMMLSRKRMPFDEEVTELAYLTLWMAMVLGGSSVFLYVGFDTLKPYLFPTINS